MQGDDRLRSSYLRCMQQLLEEQGARPVQDILDVGAATGLSSLALLRAFPDASVTGAQAAFRVCVFEDGWVGTQGGVPFTWQVGHALCCLL